MPIVGSVALATVAAPSSLSPAPYTLYSITQPGGIYLAGFILQNTANIPVNITIYQDSYLNVLYSGTLTALQGPTTVSINTNLVFGEKILALANQGGMVNVEIDGLVTLADVTTQYLQALVLMMSDAFGIEIPSQASLSGPAIFTP
jgi:hypothetical protein